jgi:hypothetical protein
MCGIIDESSRLERGVPCACRRQRGEKTWSMFMEKMATRRERDKR